MPANPDFDDLATTTIQHYSKKLADNATVSNAGLDRARRNGKVQPYDGGRTILQELEVSLNPYGGWFADLDFLDTRRHQPFSAAEYQRKQAFVPCVWSGSEKRANRGRTQMIDLVAKRIENSRKTLTDLVSIGYYSDGLSYGGKQMHGLNHLVVASPSTGTVGGIPRDTNTFWRNKTGTVDFDAAINIITNNPPTFLTAMTTLGIAVSRGNDHADMWLFDAIGFQRYMECLQPIQRVTDPKMAGYGFQSMKFWAGGTDSDVVLDNGHCPTKTGFALNTKHIYLRVHEDLNFVALGGERQPHNQDATVKFFGFEGNLCASVLFTQGRLSDV